MKKAISLLCLLLCSCLTWAGEPTPNSQAHAFYYPWYGNVETNGKWLQWNHAVIPLNGPSPGHFSPPDNIGANFFPALGCYSCYDPDTLALHMKQLCQAGVGVIASSWWGQGTYTDVALPLLLKAAYAVGIQVCVHIEPYPGRTALSVKSDLIYLEENYGSSPAWYRLPAFNNKALYYVYDSYLISPQDWTAILTPEGEHSIRKTPADALLIGLYVKENDKDALLAGGFDGAYTYFATEGFTYGSTPSNWKTIAEWARENGKLFIPSVGPGYDDTRIRPWNTKNQRDRKQGAYYDAMFQAALEVQPQFVSITSFNEWHEGTQIEPAVQKQIEDYTYLDYAPLEPDSYLKQTKAWIEKLFPPVER